jgi:hypothetical protein
VGLLEHKELKSITLDTDMAFNDATKVIEGALAGSGLLPVSSE